MTYEELLKNAPAHDSEDFIDYLRQNNEVVYEDRVCIVIKNAKYHTLEKPWHTVFVKCSCRNCKLDVFNFIADAYPHWQWLKKSADKQTVKRFHVHLTP